MDGIVKCWNLVVVGCIILACKDPALSANFHVEVVKLPPLRIGKQQIRAHTQGLELVRGNIYVTARREDVNPRQALLLRTSLSAANWEVWNITPVDADGAMLLDHPGGMQSDGNRLWIPIAESKPKSRTMIRAFSMESIVPGVPLKAEFEFPFNDHIGALAVSMQDESTHPGTNQNLLLGANWDTETVYIWSVDSQLIQRLTGGELSIRGLGIAGAEGGRTGIAVQDWKITKQGLFASGLSKSTRANQNLASSRLVILENALAPDFKRREIILPRYDGVELGREAMSVSDDNIYVLPEDLGATNRLFRISKADLLKSD